jgi:hypothetical protein
MIGSEPVSIIAIFYAPGFEEYLRAVSVREGEKNLPVSKAELNEIRTKHSHGVIYQYAFSFYPGFESAIPQVIL